MKYSSACVLSTLKNERAKKNNPRDGKKCGGTRQHLVREFPPKADTPLAYIFTNYKRMKREKLKKRF
jgi:hypothetical protein